MWRDGGSGGLCSQSCQDVLGEWQELGHAGSYVPFPGKRSKEGLERGIEAWGVPGKAAWSPPRQGDSLGREAEGHVN